MRWIRVALVAAALVVATAGCDRLESAGDTRTEPAPSLDCAYPLLWKDARYEAGIDLPASSRLGPEIGPGVVLGCGSEGMGYYPDEDVQVRRIEGVDPSIAVAARIESADRPFVWLAPGYLVESSRHPLHAAIANSWGLDAHEGFTCGRSRATQARALATPLPGQPLKVEADDPEVEALLTAPGAHRLVMVEADTAVSGLDRHGVPYVERGDEVLLVLRPCDGDEKTPGLAGLSLLIAASIEGTG